MASLYNDGFSPINSYVKQLKSDIFHNPDKGCPGIKRDVDLFKLKGIIKNIETEINRFFLYLKESHNNINEKHVILASDLQNSEAKNLSSLASITYQNDLISTINKIKDEIFINFDSEYLILNRKINDRKLKDQIESFELLVKLQIEVLPSMKENHEQEESLKALSKQKSLSESSLPSFASSKNYMNGEYIRSLRKQNLKLAQKINELKKEISRLNEEIKQTKTNKVVFVKENNLDKGKESYEIAVLLANTNLLQQELSSLESQIVEKDKNIEVLEKTIEISTTEKYDLKDEIARIKQELEALKINI